MVANRIMKKILSKNDASAWPIEKEQYVIFFDKCIKQLSLKE